MAKLTVAAIFGKARVGFMDHLLECVDVVIVFKDANPAVEEWLKANDYLETSLKGCYEHKDATDT